MSISYKIEVTGCDMTFILRFGPEYAVLEEFMAGDGTVFGDELFGLLARMHEDGVPMSFSGNMGYAEMDATATEIGLLYDETRAPVLIATEEFARLLHVLHRSGAVKEADT